MNYNYVPGVLKFVPGVLKFVPVSFKVCTGSFKVCTGEFQRWVHFQLAGGIYYEFVPRVRRVDSRIAGKGDSNSHGARPVHQIISMIKWIRTNRLSINNFLSRVSGSGFRVPGSGFVFRVSRFFLLLV